MRQASWIAFLLLSIGVLGYEAALDQQDQQEVTAVAPPDLTAADGGTGMPPDGKP